MAKLFIGNLTNKLSLHNSVYYLLKLKFHGRRLFKINLSRCCQYGRLIQLFQKMESNDSKLVPIHGILEKSYRNNFAADVEQSVTKGVTL